MKTFLYLAAFATMSLQSIPAQVVVDGAIGEDLDGQSPFETLQAAVDFALSEGETVILIQTDGPLAGMSLNGQSVEQPLTIQAGSGFGPVINTALILTPTSASHPVELRGLNVSTTGLGTPLIAGCSVTAENCIFNANPAGGGAYGPAVTTAIESPNDTGVMTLTNCILTGHVGLEAGRACRDYVLTSCVVEGRPVDLPNVFSAGIANSMNWRSGYSSRLGSTEGFVEISEPRTLTLTNCIVRGGVPLGWPNNTLPDAYYVNENSTIGPVTATNTVFHSMNVNGRGEASRLLNPALPPNQNPNSSFVHCTFRSADAWGAVYLPGGQPATHTFTNTLFDMPLSNYAIALNNPGSNATLAGNANTYHVPAGAELYPAGTAPFESTEHTYMGAAASDPTLTDIDGGLVTPHAAVVAKAVAVVPPVTTDRSGHPRPMPFNAARSDIGSDEVDETAPAAVDQWTAY